MPNNGYLRSTRRERQLVSYYKSIGWHSARSAGSHGEWDVYAYNPYTGETHFIQVKTKKNGMNQVEKNLTIKTACTVKTWIQSYE